MSHDSHRSAAEELSLDDKQEPKAVENISMSLSYRTRECPLRGVIEVREYGVTIAAQNPWHRCGAAQHIGSC
jgi:hypothetical protein